MPQFSFTQDSESFNFDINFKLAKAFILFFILILMGRLWYLQIIHGEEFREFSNKNLLKSSDVYAPRGRIYDREGKVLVENLPAYKASITPQYVDDLESLAQDLAPALDMEPQTIVKKVKRSIRLNGPFFPVDIKRHLTRDELFKVELVKLDHSGLDAEEFILRYYPYAGEVAHTLGYVREISKREIPKLNKQYQHKVKFKQKDIVGKKGLEESFDLNLRGQKGQSFVIVDAKGQARTSQTMQAIGETLKNTPSTPGSDIFTTLDIELQQKASEAFKKFKRVGSLIAMTPKGEILAWVSYPSFDPNEFSKRLSPEVWKRWVSNSDRPLRNKAIQDHYAPASTFKPVVALAGLQEKAIRANQYVHSPSRFRIGKRVWHDHTQTGQGYIEVREALERSSNVFFYKLGLQLGPDKIAQYATALGLGAPTGVPIRGEVSGHVPTKEWKKKRWNEPWQDGESANMAIGQGHMLVTTIQLAQTYSAIALDGAVYQPQIIKKVEAPSDREWNFSEKNFEPLLLRNLSEDKDQPYFIEKKHFEVVKQGLYRVVNGKQGTAKATRFNGNFSVAGKTGTAQVRRFSADQIYKPCPKRDKKEKHNGWFVGYGSYKKVPQITVAVLTEHSCTSAAAVPIAREVFEAYFKKYHNLRVEEDNVKPKS
jgi:penicillin-binding protein 2